MDYRQGIAQNNAPQQRNNAPKTQEQTKIPIPRIEIVSIRAVRAGSAGNIRAFVDVQIGKPGNCLEVRDFRIIQQPEQRAWVSPPQRQWKDEETGRILYADLVRFPDAWKEAIRTAVLTAWQEGANQ